MERSGAWIIGPESARMVELGHPWIITYSYTKRWPIGQAGQVVALSDSAGRFIASALLDPQDRIVARVLSRERMLFDQRWLAGKGNLTSM